jgi:hypothetical protein
VITAAKAPLLDSKFQFTDDELRSAWQERDVLPPSPAPKAVPATPIPAAVIVSTAETIPAYSESVFIPLRRRHRRWPIAVGLFLTAVSIAGFGFVYREHGKAQLERRYIALCYAIARETDVTPGEVEIGCKKAAAQIQSNEVMWSWHQSVDLTLDSLALYREIDAGQRLQFRKFRDSMIQYIGGGLSRDDFLDYLRLGLTAVALQRRIERDNAEMERLALAELAKLREDQAAREAIRVDENNAKWAEEIKAARAKDAAAKIEAQRKRAEKWRREAEAAQERRDKPRETLERARALDRESKFDEAVVLYNRIVSYYPTSPEAPYALKRLNAISRQKKPPIRIGQ